MKFIDHIRESGPAGLVSYHLHKIVAGIRRGRSLDRIHASDVTREDFCPRDRALCQKLDLGPDQEFVGTALGLVFAQGNLIAHQIVQWLADASLAIGDWRCSSCGWYRTFGRRPLSCDQCGSKKFRYVEVRVTSEISQISCGLDVIVTLPVSRKHEIVELKTMGKDQFKGLVMPLAEHRIRTQLYLRCLEESNHPFRGLIRTDQARVLYISKEGFGSRSPSPKEWGLQDDPWSPFKEFTVTRNDAAVEPYVEKAMALVSWQNGGPFPKGICRTLSDSRAKKCRVAKACFSGKFSDKGGEDGSGDGGGSVC